MGTDAFVYSVARAAERHFAEKHPDLDASYLRCVDVSMPAVVVFADAYGKLLSCLRSLGVGDDDISNFLLRAAYLSRIGSRRECPCGDAVGEMASGPMDGGASQDDVPGA